MTLRLRVLLVALAAIAVMALLAVQLVFRYADLRSNVAVIVDTLAPADSAAGDLATDINNMERRLRIYVSSGQEEFSLLYRASVASATQNVGELDELLGADPRYQPLLDQVGASLETWLTSVGIPAESAMSDGDEEGAQGILDSPQSQAAYLELSSDATELVTVLATDRSAALASVSAAAQRLAWAMALTLAVALLIPLASYVALRRHVLAPITRLRRQLRRAATPGEHDSVIVPDGPSEIRDLGSDAEALRRALVHEIDESDAAREALEQEGPVVDAIRRELTARSDPGAVGVLIAGVLRPAEGVLAGDFWDRISLPDGRAAAVICDVSGHGPRAGIVAMRLKTSITLGLISGQDPPQILHRACDAFADEPGRFATVVIMLADPLTGRLSWVNAGHPAPRVVRANGSIERLDPTGPMVSWLIGGWTTGSLLLGPRDLVLAFTDGILESRDASGRELGDDDLDTRLRAAAEATDDPAEATALVLAAVRERAEDLSRDDLTLVALRVDPQPQPARRIPAPRR